MADETICAVWRWRARIAGSVVAIGVGISALLPVEPAHGAELAISAQDDGADVVIRAQATLDADGAIAWRVLTDYERYAQFVPGLRSVQVVERDGPRVSVRQSGDARFWLFSVPVDIVYAIVEHKPVELDSRIVDGCGCRFESRYVLKPIGSRVRLEYRGRLTPSPGVRGLIERSAMEDTLREHLSALAGEIERDAHRATVEVADGARKDVEPPQGDSHR